MLTVTISTDDGLTVTSRFPYAIVNQAREWLSPLNRETRFDLDELREHLEASRWQPAGRVANRLGLNFAVANPYEVPTDPADATICEACE